MTHQLPMSTLLTSPGSAQRVSSSSSPHSRFRACQGSGVRVTTLLVANTHPLKPQTLVSYKPLKPKTLTLDPQPPPQTLNPRTLNPQQVGLMLLCLGIDILAIRFRFTKASLSGGASSGLRRPFAQTPKPMHQLRVSMCINVRAHS